MVKEFTDLQGIVGGLYAQAEGYPETVWRAVYEQYMPKLANSPSPETRTGALLALVDRLDTVCGCFSIGLIPSGSGDPFAVRRQANGILKIILDQRLSVSLDQLVRSSLDACGAASDDTSRELRDFFQGRLRFVFEEMGFAYDFINATLAAGGDDPLDTLMRLRALQAMREEADFLSLASNFKRIVNILAQAGTTAGLPDDSRFTDPAERSLWLSVNDVRPKVEDARRNHDYAAALRSLASMRAIVDDFFDKVLVMADDEAIKNNRLALLNQVSGLLRSIADISQIVIDRST
jgi:glycyl-tRNA synthetase beta chain